LLVASCLRLNARTREYLLKRGDGKQKEFEYHLAMGLDMALVGFLVSGTFLTVLYYPHLWVLLGISAGLNTAVAAKSSAERALADQPPEPSLPFAGAYQEGR
jgi:hypothetical protein